jgi:broad specificity phosphatase PhoE
LAAVDGTRFIFIRHGESAWNAAGRWQGRGDPPLSQRGRDQARRLAAELAGAGIEVIVASDLVRAAETAAILGDALGISPVSDAGLRELDVGRWTGLTRSQIEARDRAELEHFECGAADARAGGGECRHSVADRVHAAVAAIALRHRGCCIAVVAHLGVMRALLAGEDLPNAGWRSATPAEVSANARLASGRVRPAAH